MRGTTRSLPPGRATTVLGVAVLTTALVASAVVSTAAAHAEETTPSAELLIGAECDLAPQVQVTFAFGDGRPTSIGFDSSSDPDTWLLDNLSDGTYTVSLPAVAPGDSETFEIWLEHDPEGEPRHLSLGPDGLRDDDGDPRFVFSVPSSCEGALPVFEQRPAPTITGDLRAGATLTAELAGWSPTPQAVTYQWQRAHQGNIVGATTATYRPSAQDVDKQLRVIVLATHAGYAPARRTSAWSAPVAAAPTPAAPRPTLTGTVRVGQKLVARTTGWDPALTRSYEWVRSGTTIAGATGVTYTLRAADAGRRIAVRVTGTAGDQRVRTASSYTAVVARGTFKAPAPRVTGTPAVGRTVSVARGTWSPKPTRVTYQWYRAGVAVKGATGSSYKVTSRDKGRTLKVRVTGSRPGYAPKAATSASVRGR